LFQPLISIEVADGGKQLGYTYLLLGKMKNAHMKPPITAISGFIYTYFVQYISQTNIFANLILVTDEPTITKHCRNSFFYS
jgi:hypothetical protein